MALFSPDQFQQIMDSLNRLRALLEEKRVPYPEQFIDNSELLQLMKISKRTAQTWRDEKIIPYMKIGNKIYYKHADVRAMMENHYRPNRRGRSGN